MTKLLPKSLSVTDMGSRIIVDKITVTSNIQAHIATGDDHENNEGWYYESPLMKSISAIIGIENVQKGDKIVSQKIASK